MVIAMGFIPQMALETPRNIGFVDEVGMLHANESFTKFGDYENAKRALLDDEINAFFILHKNYRETGNVTVYSKAGLFSSPPTRLMETFLRDSLLEESKIDETIKERIKEPAKEKSITLNNKGEVEEQTGAGFFHTLRTRNSSDARDNDLFRVFDAGDRDRKGKQNDGDFALFSYRGRTAHR
ncbi:hypothetical protein C5S53_14110 [Methanophagales archaeon]|nr:hypothetical protein C5S53_14110 [Methanophagales archaeon]